MHSPDLPTCAFLDCPLFHPNSNLQSSVFFDLFQMSQQQRVYFAGQFQPFHFALFLHILRHARILRFTWARPLPNVPLPFFCVPVPRPCPLRQKRPAPHPQNSDLPAGIDMFPRFFPPKPAPSKCFLWHLCSDLKVNVDSTRSFPGPTFCFPSQLQISGSFFL